jgi:hypothetical protein
LPGGSLSSGLYRSLRCSNTFLRLEALESLRILDVLMLGLCGLSSLGWGLVKGRSLGVRARSYLRGPIFAILESSLSLSDSTGLDVVSGRLLLGLLTVRGLFAAHNHLCLRGVLNRTVAFLDDVLRVLAYPWHLRATCGWLGRMIQRVLSECHLTPGW